MILHMKQKTEFLKIGPSITKNIPLVWCWTCPHVYRVDRKVQSTLILQTLAKIGQGTYCQKPMPTLIHYQSCPSVKQRENRVKVFKQICVTVFKCTKSPAKMYANKYVLVSHVRIGKVQEEVLPGVCIVLFIHHYSSFFYQSLAQGLMFWCAIKYASSNLSHCIFWVVVEPFSPF